jgi:hypothetical protein
MGWKNGMEGLGAANLVHWVGFTYLPMLDHSDAPVERKGNRMKKLHVVFLIVQLAILFIALLLLLQNGNYGWTLFCIIPFSIGLTVGVYTRTFRTKGLLS